MKRFLATVLFVLLATLGVAGQRQVVPNLAQADQVFTHGALEVGTVDTDLAATATGIDPTGTVMVTCWSSPNGMQHEVRTPKKLGESDQAQAARHAMGVAALSELFPPPVPHQ